MIPINFQAVQTIYALEHKKEFFYLQLSSFFLTQFKFDFSIQSLLDIQATLIKSSEEWDDDELRCLAFYIIEVFTRIKSYELIWQGEFERYHAIFSENNSVILDLPVFENLGHNISDLIFTTAQLLNIDLIEQKELNTPLKYKSTQNTTHLKKFKKLTQYQKQRFYTARPFWCTSPKVDSLYEYFETIPTLLEQGFKIKARIIQANQLLFDIESTANCPAEVVFDLQSRLTYSDFESITKYLYGLRTRPTDTLNIKERRYADHLNNERERSFLYKLPYDILGYPLYTSSIFIDRIYLPERALLMGNIEILLNPKVTPYVLLCPSVFWEKELLETWHILAKAENIEQPIEEPSDKFYLLDELKILFSKHPFWFLFVMGVILKVIAGFFFE